MLFFDTQIVRNILQRLLALDCSVLKVFSAREVHWCIAPHCNFPFQI